jgi:hypothetical protein
MYRSEIKSKSEKSIKTLYWNFGLVKQNEMFRIMWMFNDSWLRDVIVEGVIYMLLETSFEGYVCFPMYDLSQEHGIW